MLRGDVHPNVSHPETSPSRRDRSRYYFRDSARHPRGTPNSDHGNAGRSRFTRLDWSWQVDRKIDAKMSFATPWLFGRASVAAEVIWDLSTPLPDPCAAGFVTALCMTA